MGLIELANGGTLFLDEVGEIPLNLQVKLLKVIQDKKITRVGGIQAIPIDFRLVSASNRDLQKLVSDRRFREDLYYRLNVIHIHIPSLKARKEDVFPLALHFLERFNQKYNLKRILSPGVVDALLRYEWPGNIRELENLMERIVLTANTDLIDVDTLPEEIRRAELFQYASGHLEEAVEMLEKRMVAEAYALHKTTVGVAKELGISQPTAVRKIKKYVKEGNYL